MSKQYETSSHNPGLADYLRSLVRSLSYDEDEESQPACDQSRDQEEDLVTSNKDDDVDIRTKGATPSPSLQTRHSTGSLRDPLVNMKAWLYHFSDKRKLSAQTDPMKTDPTCRTRRRHQPIRNQMACQRQIQSR